VHGGPFANIAHGCNSVIATTTALRLADYVVTEAGFGADLGAEKFFDITVASEVMAILCLSTDLADLQRRLGDIVVAYRRDRTPVYARDLKADGAMTVLLKDAMQPNLVQTLENNPAFVHGGSCTAARSPTSRTAATRSSPPPPPCGWPTTSSPRPASAPTSGPRSSSTSSAARPG